MCASRSKPPEILSRHRISGLCKEPTTHARYLTNESPGQIRRFSPYWWASEFPYVDQPMPRRGGASRCANLALDMCQNGAIMAP